jgi:carbon storage regulator
MLVLSRKLNESIIIADQIRVTIIGIRGNHIRLGLEAPPDVAILREELLAPVQDEAHCPQSSRS